ALSGQYRSFTGIDSAPRPFSIRAAVAQAAHDTLAALYRSQKLIFDQALADDLLRVTSERQKTNGIAFGKQIAAAILASRVGDGSEGPEVHLGVDDSYQRGLYHCLQRSEKIWWRRHSYRNAADARRNIHRGLLGV